MGLLSLISFVSIALPLVSADVSNQHQMPPGTNYQNMNWSKIVCKDGSVANLDLVKTIMNERYLDKSWSGNWVWIDSKKGTGAHVARIEYPSQGPDTYYTIEWMFTFDLNAGPKFTYLEATAEDGTTYPHNGLVLNHSFP